MVVVVRVLEFFSGIGGWRCALEKFSEQQKLNRKQNCRNYRRNDDKEGGDDDEEIVFSVEQAFDINTSANDVYEHNFHSRPSPKCINSLSRKALEKYEAELWCMSPPCQPFTRSNTSSKRDLNDQRTNALLHLVQLLQEMHFPPKYLMLENVVGFETSDCCQKLLSVLQDLGYNYAQFILTPTQFGTPNSRPRYFLVASLVRPIASMPHLWYRSTQEDKSDTKNVSPQISLEMPDVGHINILESNSGCHTIANYLEPPSFNDRDFVIPHEVLCKPSSWCFDIVSPEDTHTACFTKAYSRYAKGTGSVLKSFEWVHSCNDEAYSNETNSKENPSKRVRLQESSKDGICTSGDSKTEEKKYLTEEQINAFRLRYFTPYELLKLFGFPAKSTFSFPQSVSNKKAYELIGNSLNVDVATAVTSFLFETASDCGKRK